MKQSRLEERVGKKKFYVLHGMEIDDVGKNSLLNSYFTSLIGVWFVQCTEDACLIEIGLFHVGHNPQAIEDKGFTLPLKNLKDSCQ